MPWHLPPLVAHLIVAHRALCVSRISRVAWRQRRFRHIFILRRRLSAWAPSVGHV